MAVQTDFSGVLGWLSNEGLEVALLVLGAALMTRVIGKVARMWTGRIDAKNADRELWSEESKHLHSLVQVISYVAVGMLYILFGIQILLRFGVNLVTLVAPATVLGAALGFGAQKIVQDFLAGFFVLAERQYGYGDIVELTTATGVAAGTIEDVTLRVARLRTLEARPSSSPTVRSSPPSTSPRTGPGRPSTSPSPTTPTWTRRTRCSPRSVATSSTTTASVTTSSTSPR